MPSSPRRLALPLLAAVLALGIAGCAPVQKSTSSPAASGAAKLSAPIGDRTVQEGGDLVMALSAEPDKLDPTTSSSLYMRYVAETMCQKLYDIDGSGKLVPMLATALPTTSSDGKTVTIPLRSGVKFADGTAFDAAAVVTTLQRNLTKSDSARRSELGPLTKVAADGTGSVQLTFSAPFAPITAALADRAGMIMSPKALQEEGDDFGDHPVCVGPYKFVNRVPQTSITVERDPNYYAPKTAHFDRITYRIITDASIRAANLRSGDVQVADTISNQDVDALKKDSSLTMLQVASLGYQGITVNLANKNGVGTKPEPLGTDIASKPEVRQALSMSIDRKQLVRTVFNGYADAACSPIGAASVYATAASNACPAYDPAKAKQLLKDAGVTAPVSFEMEVVNSPDSIRLAQALQAMVKDGGFDVQIKPVEYTTLLDDQTKGKYETVQLGWSGRVDPNGNTFNFLTTGAGLNYAGYSSSEMDDLLTQAASAGSTAERAGLYGKMTALLQQDDPIIYLYRPLNLTAVSDAIGGVSTYADGVVRLSTAAFVK
ncbi:ABC transporter substrate-binding protein [Amnibacterium endophyticum]|uniref:ABC transporter substrate-binding protein n=1 Tax=Amnibacterium endophyticum TaxID=2109337 RepID=A0ABW4LFG9_9MICO